MTKKYMTDQEYAKFLHCDLMRQGCMKPRKTERGPQKTQAEHAEELTKIAGAPVLPACNNKYIVPHPAGHDNCVSLKDARRLAKFMGRTAK